MAHIVINGRSVVDWTTGDLEGDRRYVFQAYQDFIKELLASDDKEFVIRKWQVSIDNQIDDFPRIWIARPVI